MLNTASDAVIGSSATAAQLKLTNEGQLIQDTGGTQLYAVVETRANDTVTKLKMSWSTTPATAGAFAFRGDFNIVEWTIPTITRPQNSVSSKFQDLQSD